MAEDKKSFIAYADWEKTFEALPDEKAGQLIKHLFAFVNDKNPKSDDLVINVAFAGIQSTLERDLPKWKASKQKKSNGGSMGNLKRWNPDIYNKVVAKEITLEDAKIMAKDRNAIGSDRIVSDSIANIAVSDSVSDSVSVSVSDSVSDINNPIGFIPPKKWKEFLLAQDDLNLMIQRTGRDSKKMIEKFVELKQLEGAKTAKDLKTHCFNWCNKQEIAKPKIQWG